MIFRKLIFLILIISLFFSPIFGGKEKKAYELIYEDIQLIKKQLKKLEGRIDENSKRINEIYELVKLLTNQLTSLQRIQSDLVQNNEYFRSQLQLITEKLNETSKQILRTQEEIMAFKSTSTETTSELKKEETTQAPQESEVTSQEEQPISFLSPQQIYNTAYSDYLKGNYELAVAGFREYIERFRESPLADNAQYWIGECYYSQQEYKHAIEEFNKLILNFPQGDKVPAAYLKKAYSLSALGEKEQSIAVLKLLIAKFPETEEAKLAEQKINEVS